MDAPTYATAPQRRPLTRNRYLYLCAWIASYTYTLDVVSEFKLYDFFLFGSLFVFGPELQAMVRSRSRSIRSLRFLLWMFAWGSCVSLASQGFLQEPSMERALVIGLRFVRVVNYAAIFGVIRCSDLSPGRLRWLQAVLLLSALLQAVLICLQKQGVLPILWPEIEQYYGVVLTGTLSMNHSNNVLFMSVGIVAALGFFRVTSSWRKWTLPLCILVMTIAMLVGEARTSFLALAVLALGFLRSKTASLCLALSFALVPLLAWGTGLDLRETAEEVWEGQVMKAARVDDLRHTTSITDLDVGRPTIWRDGLRALAARPHLLITGVGYQNYLQLHEHNAGGGHNMYLHTTAELGLLGLLGYGLLFAGLVAELRSLPRDRRIREALVIPGTTLILVLLTTGMVQQSLYPFKSLAGFMGFALAYLAVITHGEWRRGATWPSGHDNEHFA